MWGTAVHGPFQLSACLVSLPPRPGGLGRAWPREPPLGSHVALILVFSGRLGTFFTSLHFPSGSPSHRPCTLLQAMPRSELWPAGPGSEPVTRIGSCDSIMSTVSTRSGSVRTLRPAARPPCFCLHARPAPPCPPARLAAPSLSSSLSESESHRLVFLPLSHPGSREKGWDSPKAQ